MYLPESVPPKTIDIVIKHPQINGVDFLKHQVVPKSKHLSVNTLNIAHKAIKKVAEIRHFHKPTSVFAKWNNDTDKVIYKAFETDMELTKIKKFVKDPDDRKKLLDVLLKYYANLKN